MIQSAIKNKWIINILMALNTGSQCIRDSKVKEQHFQRQNFQFHHSSGQIWENRNVFRHIANQKNFLEKYLMKLHWTSLYLTTKVIIIKQLLCKDIKRCINFHIM